MQPTMYLSILRKIGDVSVIDSIEHRIPFFLQTAGEFINSVLCDGGRVVTTVENTVTVETSFGATFIVEDPSR